MKCNLFKRITSVFLAVVLIFSNLPAAVFAAEDTGLCAHHTVHMDCGYQEAAAGADCTHVCGEDCYEAVIACVHLHEDCGYVAAVEEIPCDHVHADCGYTEAVEGTPCDHVHGDCGYAEAVEGTPCDHAHGDCGYVAAVEGTPCDHVCGEDCTESCVHSCEDGTCTYTEGVGGSDCTHVCGDGSCGYCEGIPGGECTHVCTDGSCAYREGVNGTPCTHTCGDGTCAYTPGMAERPCDHQCTEESGCVTRVLRCGHVHDEACGYVQAQAAQPCGYECQLCREEEQAPAELDSVTRQFTRQANPDPGLPENEELFQAYVEQMLFDTQLATFGTKGRDSLNEAEQELYDALKVHIESVALSGGDTSYVLTSPQSLKTRWTNEELNMDSLTEEAVQAAFDAQFDPDALVEALIRDCPFELYWYDKTAGMETTYSLSLEGYNDGTADFWTAASVEDVTFAFYVAQDYQGSRYSVTTDVETVARVRETAQELADAGKQLNDREALESFRTYICGAVSYDHDAADDATRPYGDPWQLIHVFDGDDTTNVVCEGYAKAFQYLCDLGDLDCECVSGQLTSQGETEAHMWNVVTLDGDRLLVDVTNCDEGTVGADTQLFLVTAPYVSGTYTFDCDGTEVTYTCADLNLAAEDEEEQPEEHTHTIDETTGQCACGLYGTCGENLTWTFAEESGILTISGEGDMPDYSYTEVPWYGFRTSVQKVALDERITTIGNNAFYGFTKLKEVTIPAGVTRIGMAAFWECGSLTEITIPDQVKEIGYAAFSGCSSLTTIVFPESITYVGDRAFEYCSKLASINIPSGVTCIREYTFAYCTALERITIPKNVVCIEKYAFRNCSSLTAIDFRGEPPTIYDTAFTGVTATARYSKDMPVWSSYRKDYGGTITWVAYGLCDEGHTEVTYPGSAPTCTEPGSTPLKYCEVCLEILLADELIPATGHTEVIDEAVDATCTTPGLTEGKHCSVCGEILVKQEEVMGEHDYEGVYTEPTYDADGFTTYTCIHCGDSYTETDPGTMKTAAASIGDIKCGTLAEAFAAAKAGDTIEMLKSYTVTGGTTETWDLTGKTLAISRTGVSIYAEGNLNIVDGTFRFSKGIEHILVRNNGRATIEDGIFHVCGSWGIWVNYGQLIINGGTFYVTGDGQIGTQARFSGSNKMSRITVNDGVFYFRDNGAFYDYGMSSIKGGTFYLERQKKASIIAGYSDYRDALSISGGTFYINGPVGFQADYYSQFYIRGGTFLAADDAVQIIQNDGAALGIYGGTFSQDMTSYLGSDYCCPKTETGYVVGQHSYTVEKAEDTYLKTQADCLNGAEYYLSCACGKQGTETFFSGDPLGHAFENGVCTVCGEVNRCGENINWTLENGVLTITGTGPMYDFTREDSAPWYEDRNEIRELSLADGITTIGSYAFYGCTGLTEVTIPESVISIGEYAFGGCSGLKNVTVPDSVTNVSGSAFSGCSGMGTVVIPSGMDKIDDDSLEGCEGLRELWFRGDFPEISANAFKGVVATAWYPADNPTWTADKLLNYGGTITWKPYCLGEHTEVTDEAVAPTCTEPGLTEGRHCSVCGEVFVKQETVPAGHTVVGGVCTMCGLYGTCGDNLTWIFTPESGILSISGRGKMTDYSSPDDVPWALQREYIQKVICIPGITSVGSNAFLYCEALTSVTIPKGVTIIGDCAFYGCSALTEVKLPEGVTDIGNEAFAVCYSLKGIEIPDTVTRIGAHAFKDCGSLLDIQLPDKVSDIGMGAFYYCSSLRSMVIPLGVTSIYNSTFAGCNSLNKIVLPESVKVIGSNVFDGCISLNEITIPKSVTSINTLAFKDCNNLHAIYFLGNAPFFDADVFNGVIATAYYPSNNDTWTAEKIENCGGIITWEPYCPNGHTEVNDEAVAPTCTEPGLTEGKHCSACGEVLVAQEEIPATGHSFEENLCTSCGIVGITLKTQPEDAYALEGEYAIVTVEAEGEELTYKWFYRNAGASGFVSTSAFTGNTYKVAMNAARSGRQLYCMITDKYGNSVATDIVTIGLKTPLEITGQPVSVTVAEGANAIATVRAEGDDLTYAWYYKNAGDKAFHLTESFKGASYTVKMNEDRNGRQVYCVITDRYGNSLKSDTVTLSMRTTLLITGQPESVTVVKNETAAVTVAAQGDGLTYQWYFKDISHSKFYLTNSFKGASYQIQMNDVRSGRQVYCVVTDQYGNSTVSDTATLSMMTLARITRQPESVKVDEGANAVASIRAEGDDLTYQWYFKDTSHSKFYLTNSFKGSSYTVSMNENRDGRKVYCVITDRYGNSVQSDTVTLSMIHPVTITKQPVSVAVPEGETAKLILEARGEGLSYAWYYKNAGADKFILTTSFTGSTYSVAMNESRSGRQVYCVVTDQYGNTAVSDTVTLSLRTPLRITQQPVSARVAEGSNAVVSLRAQGDGLTYQWYWAAADSDHFQLTNTFRGSSYTVSMNDSRDGRRVYCVITDRYGDSVTSDTVTLAMIRPVKLVKMPELAIANEGEKLSVTLEALGDGLTYAWYFKNAGGTKFYLTTSFTGPTYSVIMNSERDGRQIYCVVTDQYGHSVTSDTLTLQMRK